MNKSVVASGISISFWVSLSELSLLPEFTKSQELENNTHFTDYLVLSAVCNHSECLCSHIVKIWKHIVILCQPDRTSLCVCANAILSCSFVYIALAVLLWALVTSPCLVATGAALGVLRHAQQNFKKKTVSNKRYASLVCDMWLSLFLQAVVWLDHCLHLLRLFIF